MGVAELLERGFSSLSSLSLLLTKNSGGVRISRYPGGTYLSSLSLSLSSVEEIVVGARTPSLFPPPFASSSGTARMESIPEEKKESPGAEDGFPLPLLHAGQRSLAETGLHRGPIP